MPLRGARERGTPLFRPPITVAQKIASQKVNMILERGNGNTSTVTLFFGLSRHLSFHFYAAGNI